MGNDEWGMANGEWGITINKFMETSKVPWQKLFIINVNIVTMIINKSAELCPVDK